MIDVRIVDIKVDDIRFPASVKRAKTNVEMTDFDPDYNCIYVTIETNEELYKGYGIAVGLNIELKKIVISLFNKLLKNQKTTRIYNELGLVWRKLSTTTLHWLEVSKFKYLRPAATAIVNALWDLWARIEDKPVWKLLTDMTPQELITTIDFSEATDVITPEEALEMLTEKKEARENYEKILKEYGYPASATGIGYYNKLSKYQGPTYQRIRDLCRNFKKLDFTTFEVYTGETLEESSTRCKVVYSMTGWRKRKLVLNANETTWDLKNLSSFLNKLHETFTMRKPYCIELSTASYDIEKYLHIQNNMNNDNITFSSGEKCNSHLEFKKFAKFYFPDIWQINIAKVGGLNEALIVYLMAHKMQIPVWLHGDGLGLSEMGQHVQMWDFVCLSQTTENRMIEFANYQHGYFESPVYIRNACYMPPIRPGFSTKLKKKCIEKWSYPESKQWQYLIKIRKTKGL